MARWLAESLQRLFGSLVQFRGCARGKQFQEETRQTELDRRVSKPDWSELPAGVANQDILTSIELSKAHWSELPEGGTGSEILAEAAIQESNRTSWKALQELNPFFFQDWGEKVQVGQQIAEGGQAQIYEATWKKDEYRRLPEEMDMPKEMIVKVFKLEGCTLEDFTCQWPRITATAQTELEFERVSEFASLIQSLYICPIVGAFFLKNNRFAFLMQRYDCDLRSFLHKKKHDNEGRGGPPFPSHDGVLYLLYCIAKGMKWLHGHGILHRDLKASNVLVRRLSGSKSYRYAVADYECSMSTVGTGFWRAPEVLQEMRHRRGRNVGVWTTKSDVYSFGITCFEVFTGGGDPFPEFSSRKDWAEIIDHHKRPRLPDYVDFKLRELVEKCWDKNPLERPSFRDIVKELKLMRFPHPRHDGWLKMYKGALREYVSGRTGVEL